MCPFKVYSEAGYEARKNYIADCWSGDHQNREHAPKLGRAGHDAVHFELGEPGFDTPPPIANSC